MNLHDVIVSSIVAYPSLYRDINFKRSRLAVLHQLFMVLGSGAGWDKAGQRLSKETFGKQTLPKGYFKKNLWAESRDKATIKKFVKHLKREHPGNYFFLRQEEYSRNTTIIFECSEAQALALLEVFPRFDGSKFLFKERHEPVCYPEHFNIPGFDQNALFAACGPYPQSRNYSTFVDMTNGVTTRGGIKLNPLPEYIKAGVEIAREALLYYVDDDRVVSHSYYPGRTSGTTTEGWNTFRNEQLDILRSFLAKFDR